MTLKNWHNICRRVDDLKLKNWDTLYKIYRAAFITVGFFCVVAMSYTFRMRKELALLQKWKKHELDNDWSDSEKDEDAAAK